MWFVSKIVMAVPDPRRAGIVLLLACSCLACASSAPPPPPHAETKPAAATPTQPAPEAAVPAPEPALPEAEESKAPYGDAVIVLDSGGQEAGAPKTLADAARAEREKRAHARPPVAVITNQSLKQSKGQVTFATPAKKAVDEKPVADAPAQPVRDEVYWRSHALEIRLRWRHAADAVKELEQSSAGWRRRFYAENDTYVRNGQIKPEWDRVLDRLEEARADVETAQKELAELLEEGRLAGALPGWLREGMDEEPKEEPKKPSETHHVIDPPVVGEDGQNRA